MNTNDSELYCYECPTCGAKEGYLEESPCVTPKRKRKKKGVHENRGFAFNGPVVVTRSGPFSAFASFWISEKR